MLFSEGSRTHDEEKSESERDERLSLSIVAVDALRTSRCEYNRALSKQGSARPLDRRDEKLSRDRMTFTVGVREE